MEAMGELATTDTENSQRRMTTHPSEQDPHRSIFVGGLPQEVGDGSLTHFFSAYGAVDSAKVIRDKTTGWSKGYGFVVFRDSRVAEYLRSCKKVDVGGRTVDIGPAQRGVGKNSVRTNGTQNDHGGRKVFVGGIPKDVDEATMKWFFSNFGTCQEFKIVYDQTTGVSKGYGFATFQDKGSADHVKRMQHVDFNGKKLNVNEASRNGGSPGAHGGVQWYLMGYHPYLQYAYDPMGFPPQNPQQHPSIQQETMPGHDPTHTVFCGGIPPNATEQQLMALFSQFGPVVKARIIMDPQTRQSKGYGFITFANAYACQCALAQQKISFYGKLLDIGPAKRRVARPLTS